MSRVMRLSPTYIAIGIAVILVIAAYAAVVLVPRCSVLMQKFTGFAARISNDSALATAPACTQAANSNEVYFVSCGGFF